MRIVITADIHADEAAESGRAATVDRLREQVHEENPDVFIVAGDLVGLAKSHIRPTLERLAPAHSLKLIVPGNHDLWLREGSSFQYYREVLPELYADCGYHMLDAGAKVAGQVAFVGNVGWYDYSFRDPELPPGDGRSYGRKEWDGVTGWNDGRFVKLDMTDPEFNRLLLADLRRQIESVPPEVDTIVAVTHHIAFEEMVIRKQGDPGWNFCNGFLGSQGLGELLLKYPRVKHHFCGHTHCRHRAVRGGLTSTNVGSTYDSKRVEVLQLP